MLLLIGFSFNFVFYLCLHLLPHPLLLASPLPPNVVVEHVLTSPTTEFIQQNLNSLREFMGCKACTVILLTKGILRWD